MSSAHPLTKKGGFTLIEVLIVLIVISIVAIGVTLSIGHTTSWNQKLFVDEVREKLFLLQEYALLQPANVRVSLGSNRIQFFTWQVDEAKDRGAWVAINESYLEPITIPAGLSVRLDVATDATEEEEAEVEREQAILISLNGDWTPFHLWIGPAGAPPTYRINGLLGGELTMTLVGENT